MWIGKNMNGSISHKLVEQMIAAKSDGDRDFAEKISNSVKFVIPTLSNLPNLPSDPKDFDLVRPPFPLTLIECPKERSRQANSVILLEDYSADHATSYSIHVFVEDDYGEWLGLTSWHINKNPEKEAGFDILYNPGDLKDKMEATYPKLVLLLLEILQCTNIKQVDIQAPKKLNKKRAAKGRQPLFSYKVLEIETPREVGDKNEFGGTHASPRVHLRRGHIRNLPDGRKTWVQPCVVGDKSKGVVHKHYSVKPK